MGQVAKFPAHTDEPILGGTMMLNPAHHSKTAAPHLEIGNRLRAVPVEAA
jgi:hypothetical protein